MMRDDEIACWFGRHYELLMQEQLRGALGFASDILLCACKILALEEEYR